MDNQTIINVILLGIVVAFALVGLVKGLLAQAIELAGTIGTFILALLMSGAVARYLEARFAAPYSVWLVAGFIGLVLVGLLLTRLLAVAIGKVVKMTILNMVDRFAGAVLGLIMGGLVASLLIWVTLELPFPRELRRDVATSSMGLYLRPIAGQVFDWVVSHRTNIHFEDLFKQGRTV